LAFVFSCDVYFYHLGLLIGPDILSNYAQKFALGKPTNIDIVGEVSGFVPSVSWKRWKKHKRWFKGDTLNFSIGQGDLLVSPLQMLRLISIFANGGFLVRPYLVEEIGNKPYLKNKIIRRVPISHKYLKLIREILVDVVRDPQGTAHILDMSDLSVAGKTGTAQVRHKSAHGWFIGFTPVDKPKIAFCIFIEHGGSSAIACLVGRKMLEELKKIKFLP
jgi:penicillin-binding protein 2